MRRRLVLRFSALLGVTLALLVAGLMVFALGPITERVISNQFNYTTERVEGELTRQFLPVETLLAVLGHGDRHPWAADSRSPVAFNAQFKPVLERMPQITSIVAGNAAGRGWMLLEQGEDRWLNRLTDPAQPGRHHFFQWQGEALESEEWRSMQYDPRQRPWYKSALRPASHTVHWTEPYLFFTTGDPGITGSILSHGADGEALVVGFDLRLNELSRITREIKVGERGLVMVLTAEHRLLGLPGLPQFEQAGAVKAALLSPADRIELGPAGLAYAEWRQQGQPAGHLVEFDGGDGDWLARFDSFRLGERQFWIAVVAPEADFRLSLASLAEVISAVILLALALALFVSRRIARRVSAPLEVLANESERIGRLDFAPTPVPESDIREVRQLTLAHDKMRNLLQQYQQTVADQEQGLRDALESLRFLAHHDPLTSLPNRVLFYQRLAASIDQAARNHGELAVLFVDLDHFKVVNDSLGHEIGDNLLQQVAQALNLCLRGSDLIARHGGDEFIVLAEAPKVAAPAEEIANRLIEALSRPFLIEGNEFYVTCSIGIALYPQHGADGQALLRCADTAMYRAKGAGRNRYEIYVESMNNEALERVRLESQLRRAIEFGQLQLHYQPQVNLQTGELVGVEALCRWYHPELGQVPPTRFIPLAEETGFIVTLGAWVLHQACQQVAAWQNQGIELPRVSINVSVRQLERGNLVELISETLIRSGLEPQRLELEITESFFLPNGQVYDLLYALRNLGIQLAVDDFGTGYSSLAYLKQLPIHRLKIDQSFVRDIGRDANDEGIVRAIVTLGRNLNLKPLAEGVETPEQAEFLRREGCQEAQGYLYARPMPAAEFIQWLQQRQRG
ncbi:MAG: hypothetical protein RIR00_1314 [Pseudomonadota bacterium]|jgi:diguanylate cyclase (GGDEF)-like protein